jgi:hypothetical protein
MGCAFFISLSYSPALGAEFRNFEAPSEKLIDRLPSFRSRTLSSPQPIPKVQKKEKKVIPESVYLKFENKFDGLNPSEKQELNKFFFKKSQDGLNSENWMEYKHYKKSSDMLRPKGQ